MSEQDLARARWEDQADVSRKFRFNFRNFWLGRAEDGTALGYNDDRHICLVSGNRAGKGSTLIINNLSYWPGSAVVIDPKGENATVTAARRGQGNRFCDGMGQQVVVLDPFKVAQVDDVYRNSFNPLDTLDPTEERCIDDAARIANALIVVREDSKDPFFDESARALVKALILHVLTAEEFEEDQRTLSMIHDLLKRGDWRIAQAVQDRGETEVSAHKLLFRSMECNNAFDGVVAGNGTRYLGMLQNSPKTFESVLDAALLNTDFLDSPGMRRVVQRSSFKLSQLKDNPLGVTLYLSLPQDYMDTHYRWLRLMIMLTIGAMQKSLLQPATGHRVLFVLDEFAGLKRMPAIENAVAQLAGFGVKLFFVLQSLEQLKSTYKDNWETFLANAGLKILFSIEDQFTRKYASDLMGMAEVIRYTDSSSQGMTETENVSHGTSRSQNENYGTAKSTNSARTEGTSATYTSGENQGLSQSRSQNENWGRNESTTDGRSESVMESRNQGVTESRNQGVTDGSNQSVTKGRGDGRNWSDGSSKSVSYKERSFLGLFRSIDAGSVGYTSGSNTSFGGSSSTNFSQTDGTSFSRTSGSGSSRTSGSGSSRTDGTSSSRTNGSSYGHSEALTIGSSKGSSESQSQGQSHSASEGQSDSISQGRSHGNTESQNRSQGNSRSIHKSRNQAIHQRPLLRPEEFGKLFARISDPDHPAFPGFALVLINGADPIVVRRCNYFDDVQFIDWFTPHPQHKYTPPLGIALKSIQPLVDKLFDAADHQTEPMRLSGWRVKPHHVVNSGDILFNLENIPNDGRTISIRSPCNRKAITLSGTSEWPYIDADPVFLLKHYPNQEGSIVDPIAELRETCASLEAAAAAQVHQALYRSLDQLIHRAVVQPPPVDVPSPVAQPRLWPTHRWNLE